MASPPAHEKQYRIRGIGKILWRLRSSGFRKLQALLGTWLDEAQSLEDFLQRYSAEVGPLIDSDLDWVLNAIGKIVGRGRGDLNNAEYRMALRVQIRINRSQGKTEDYLEIARLTVNDETLTFELTEYGPAAVQITMLGGVLSATALGVLWQNLRLAKGGGIRLEFYAADPVATDTDFFRFSDGTEGPGDTTINSTHGFAEDESGSSGGHFIGGFST